MHVYNNRGVGALGNVAEQKEAHTVYNYRNEHKNTTTKNNKSHTILTTARANTHTHTQLVPV